MNYLNFALGLMLITGILLSGCTNQTEPAVHQTKNTDLSSPIERTPTGIPRDTPYGAPGVIPMTEQPGKTTDTGTGGSQETLILNSTKEISLKENPTTGYVWNVTVSAGLRIETDEYRADLVKPGIVGSGGMHYWIIRGIQKGNQTFNAVYKRPWEPLQGNESRYTEDINVV